MNGPSYPARKHSNIDWSGLIPADWGTAAIKYLGKVTLGKMLQSESRSEHDTSRPYLRAAHIQPTGLSFAAAEQSMWFSPAESRNLDLLADDVVVVEGGAGYGRSATLDSNLEGWGFQNSINRIRPSLDNEGRFIDYCLKAALASGYIEVVCGVATIPHLTAEKLSAERIPLPPPAIQRAVCHFLDRETAKIDALIAKQEQLIATLREDRAATITHAVTKGLDPNAPLRETGTKWVDTIPENWILSRFSRHVSINSGQVDPRLEPYRHMTLIAPNHIESRTGKLLEAESAEEQGADSGKYRVSAGQVIYSKIRPNLAKVTMAPVDCLCSADMYGLSTDPHELLSEFLLYELLSQPFTDYVIDSSMRVAMPKVNHDSLGAAPIWFPSIEEQYKVVEFLNARCARIDALIDKSTEMIETLREYRSALITNAVTGKIDVREAV